jgi:hypothetical protein
MKKIFAIITIAILCATFTSCSAQVCTNTETMTNEWSGFIRIEGKDDSVWSGTVAVDETYFDAKNVDTGETQEYHISFPSVLGALIEASDIAGFSYVIEYWPSWDAFLVKTIDGDSDWWHYWVDYEVPMVGAGDYELTDQDTDILWGYLESWEAHALKISVDKSEVKKDEEFTVSVFDETDNSVEGATVYVGANTFTTDSSGSVTIQLSEKGSYSIYSEKDGFVRSEEENMQVKSKSKLKNFVLHILINLIEHFPALERLLQPLIDSYR